MSGESLRVAAIDLGSAKAKLTVAEYEGARRVALLHREKKVTNLAHGLQESGVIADDAVNRLSEVLDDYSTTLDRLGVSRTRILGTQAIRHAQNSSTIDAAVSERFGRPLDVLTQAEEGQLFFGAVSAAIDGRVAAIDVGGGSVQVAIGANGILESQHFLRTGTVALKSMYVKGDMPTEGELSAARQRITSELSETGLSNHRGVVVYGSTNIIDFVNESGVAVRERPDDQLHPLAVSIGALGGLYTDITRTPYVQRDAFFPSDPSFMYGADMSLLNVLCISERLGADEVVPTNLNLSDGVLDDLARQSF